VHREFGTSAVVEQDATHFISQFGPYDEVIKKEIYGQL
jgi:hypothetical protein